MLNLSFYKNITTTLGAQKTLGWNEAVDYLTGFEVREKKDGPLYSPALYNGDPIRQDVNVVGMSAVIIDIDNSEGRGSSAHCVASPTVPEDHESNLDGVAYIWHSTHSHKPDWPKWRLIMPLSRSVTPEEWPAVFAGACNLLGNDPNIDMSCKDLSRAYYMPSTTPEFEGWTFSGSQVGKFLDPDHLIELSGIIPPTTAPTTTDYVAKRLPLKLMQGGSGPTSQGRNDSLKAIVGAMMEREESLERIISEVIKADNKNNPPLFQDKTETQYAGLNVEAAAMKFVSSIYSSIVRDKSKKGLPVDVPYIRDEIVYKPLDVEYLNEEGEKEIEKVIPVPAHLLNPGGMMGSIASWINETAIKPQPVLALAASIAACGVIMGRRVMTETGLRTNLFTVGLGETSCGKEHARQKIKDLFVATGCNNLLGPEEVASDAGLMRSVVDNPAQLLQIDEIGYMLRSIKADTGKAYKSDILPTIMKLDSSASSMMIGKVYGDRTRNREDVYQPCVCVYGTSVPCRFLAALNPDEVMDGFIPRMLVFETTDHNPKRVRIGEMNRNPSGLLVSLVKAWVDEPIPMKKGNLTNIPGGPDIPDPRSIRLSDEAWEKFDEFETFVRERQNSLRESGLSGLWGKTEATAMKLALIHACSLRMTTEEIGIESANWGIELASLLTQNMVVRADKHISHSQIEADAKKLLRDIEHGGTKGIAHTELYQNNRKHGKKQFHDLIDALKDWGSISVYSEVKGSNKPQTRYIATAYLKKEIS